MTLGWIRGVEGGAEEEREREERERQEAPSAEAARVSTLPVSVATSPARARPAGAGPGPDWVPVGPSTVILGQLDGVRGRVAGRVSCLAVSADGERIYAGTGNGGLWYSGDGGQRWIPLDSYESRSSLTPDRIIQISLAIGAVYVLFGATAALDQVFVATGEAVNGASAFGRLQHAGIGIRTAGDGVATGPVPAVLANPAANPWTRDATAGADALIDNAIYRIAAKLTAGPTPTIAKMFLATSAGLFVRDFTVATAAQRWERLREGNVWDVAWDGTRLWIASHQKLEVSTNEGASFTDVPLADTFGSTTAAAAPPARPSFARISLALLPAGSGVYVLSGGGRLWRAAAANAVPVTGLPYDMFGADDAHAQDHYDITIAAWTNPAGGDIVLAGGQTQLIRGTIAAPAAPAPVLVPVRVERGTHADYHALVVRTLGASLRVYAGNDGGVFRSDTGATLDSFRTMNNGLAVLEPYFLAATPLSETKLFIGMQDNGAALSTTAETWTHVFDGDAGGVAIDPADSRRMAAQYVRGSWRVTRDDARVVWFPAPTAASPDPLGAAQRQAVTTLFTAATTAEQEAGAFYSAASAIVDPATGKTLLAIGVRRPWLSDDWGKTWKTLPTFTDPAAQAPGTAPGDARPRADQDELGTVTVVRFAGPDRLLVLTEEAAFHFQHLAASGTDPERWVKKKLASPFGSSTSVRRTDIVGHLHGEGPLGSAYMTLTRPNKTDRQHHVYWFDGIDNWLDCRLDIDAATNAVIVDPLEPRSVYVGTDVGVFRGTIVVAGTSTADNTWTWVHFSDGLPESPVVDLVIDTREESAEPPIVDRVRLLRAALAGRGVFEIPVSHTARIEPAIVAYVRAHEEDLRRSVIPATPRRPYPAAGVDAPRTRLLVPSDYAALSLDASPDIRVRRAPGSAFPRLTPDGSTFNTTATSARDRTFRQIAIHAARRASALGPPVAVTGIVESESLTDAAWQALATGPAAGGRKTNTLPFGADPTGENPDCTDVVELILDEPDPGGFCSCSVPNQPARIDVVVHTRHYKELATSRVKVALLRAEYSNASGTPSAADLPAAWRTEVFADRTRTGAARGAWLSGTAWSYVDSTSPIREVGSPIDARRAAVATFQATLPAGTWMLAAVVLADDDHLDTPSASNAPLEVARTSRHVALRSVHAVVEPIHHTLQEWHQSQAPDVAYRGAADDQRVVERLATGVLHRLPKPSLHLCLQESAVATFEVALAPGDHFLEWEILRMTADATPTTPATFTVIRTHPRFTPAALTASSPAALVTSGQYAWRWDGRDSAGVLVTSGTYVSRLGLKDPTGAKRVFATTIAAEGEAHHVRIACIAKADADLIAAVAAAPQGPIDMSGERITTDCDVRVSRGGGSHPANADHPVFLGHGAMESAAADAAPRFGAIAIPHRSYKGFIDRASTSTAYQVAFESSDRSDGGITLHAGTGPAPLNPWVTPSAARIEGVRIVETTADYTTPALPSGIVVRSRTGTCAAPAATRGAPATVRARNATFGTFGTAAGEDLATSTPALLNKQTKRPARPADAIDIDDHMHAQLQPLFSECAPSPDEPLHMQRTLQAAVFGGYLQGELPMTPLAPATLAGRLALDVALLSYSEDSAYHAYHHAVVLGHTYRAAANELSAHIPRKVIRGWNGQGREDFGVVEIVGGRNVLVVGHITLLWYVENVPPTGPAVILASLIGTAPSTFAALPNLGRITRPFTMPATRPTGLIRSVFRYRLQLAPFTADHRWVPESLTTTTGTPGPLRDHFSSHAATLAPETLDGDTLVGQSVMILP